MPPLIFSQMKTKQITELHERAALILERIADFESIIAIHNHNLTIYDGIFQRIAVDQRRKIARREIAIVKLWGMYNATINEIQEHTKFKSIVYETE
jgi:hypothetical protein